MFPIGKTQHPMVFTWLDDVVRFLVDQGHHQCGKKIRAEARKQWLSRQDTKIVKIINEKPQIRRLERLKSQEAYRYMYTSGYD